MNQENQFNFQPYDDDNAVGEFNKYTKGVEALTAVVARHREYFIKEGYEVAVYKNLQFSHANLYCYHRVGQDENLMLHREYWATDRGTVKWTERSREQMKQDEKNWRKEVGE